MNSAKYRFILVTVCVLVVLLLSTTALAASPELSGSAATGATGDTIEYQINIANNPGIAGLMLYVDCDTSVFSIAAGQDGSLQISQGSFSSSGSFYANTREGGGWQVMWFNAVNVKTDGCFAIVTFTVAADAAPGTYPIEIAYSAPNTVDQNGNTVEFACVNGSIVIGGTASSPLPSAEPSEEPSLSPSADPGEEPSDSHGEGAQGDSGGGEETGDSTIFSDLPRGHWSFEYVSLLVARGIVDGVGNNCFSPDSQVTRAQFVKMLCGAVGARVNASGEATPFSDVPPGEWYSAYVCWAYENGIVFGVSDTKLCPDSVITREQMCTMIKRAADKLGITLPQGVDEIEFNDSADISEFALEAVSAMQRAGLLNGYTDGSFSPQGTASRAEAAKVLALLLTMREKADN